MHCIIEITLPDEPGSRKELLALLRFLLTEVEKGQNGSSVGFAGTVIATMKIEE